jgi:predicted P-loop ATPase/GTPase
MESGRKFKNRISPVVRLGSHYQQRVRTGSIVECAEMGRIIGLGARRLDDYRGFKSGPRVLQSEIQGIVEVCTRYINHKENNQGSARKGRFPTCV